MGRDPARRRNRSRRAAKKAAHPLPAEAARHLDAEDAQLPPAVEGETEERDAPMAPSEVRPEG